MDKTKTYHGTSPEIVKDILTHGISVLYGGGELGQGFYTGEILHEAKAWAYHKTKAKSKKDNVIEFEHYDEDIINLDDKWLNPSTANLKRYELKRTNQTRTYRFGVDLVWSRIVGSDRANGIQYKWESKKSELLLNNPDKTIKTTI